MDELVEWLRARLHEDKTLAIAATRDDPDNLWRHQPDRAHRDYLTWFADPKTVLADIAAKRAVLDRYAEARQLNPRTLAPRRRDREDAALIADATCTGLELAIRALASAYRHRPGWKQEWEA